MFNLLADSLLKLPYQKAQITLSVKLPYQKDFSRICRDQFKLQIIKNLTTL